MKRWTDKEFEEINNLRWSMPDKDLAAHFGVTVGVLRHAFDRNACETEFRRARHAAGCTTKIGFCKRCGCSYEA